MAFLLRKLPPGRRAELAALPCLAPGATTARALRRLGFARVIVAPALRPAACRRALARLQPRQAAPRRR
jgi:uroporphyrinogen-III synthase